jgi:flagellar hook protein FlgE
MFNSFSSALAALKAHAAAVDTVGHNLANVNTTGFKSVDIAFKDLVAESMGGQSEIGMGVAPPITVRNFTQGAIQASSGALDAALQGNGFFIVRDPSNSGSNVNLYTRDGSFQVDRKGFVQTLTGERVQGYAVAPDGTRSTTLGDIVVPTGTSSAKLTKTMSVFANLNANAAAGDKFSSSVEVVDSIGKSHVVTMTFTKGAAAGEWTMQASIPGEQTSASGATAGTPFDLLTTPTDIKFDTTGKMTTPAAPGSVDIKLPSLVSGADDLTVAMQMYDPTGAPTLSQVSAESSTSKTVQDGVRAGQITGVGMGDEGKVIARYDSGEERVIAQLGIAITSNPGSMQDAGNNLFRPGVDTADMVDGVAGAGGRGQVKAGALEGSTVDIAREFTNLIVFQRGYQANSRVITTTDELTQETINLKR